MDIVNRIRKLHALATKNSNVEEAASAAIKAQELCFKHNLDLQEILKTSGETSSYTRFNYLVNMNRLDMGWKRSLLNILCLTNFCKVVFLHRTKLGGIIGEKHNIEVAIYLFEYLTGEIERLGRTAEKLKTIVEGKDRGRYYRGFCTGASVTIQRRLWDMFRSRSQSTTESTALVVVKDKELKKAVKENFPNVEPLKNGSRVRADAYEHGKSAGESIPINQGVGGTGQSRLLTKE